MKESSAEEVSLVNEAATRLTVRTEAILFVYILPAKLVNLPEELLGIFLEALHHKRGVTGYLELLKSYLKNLVQQL